MAYFAWTEDLRVNEPMIDLQHKRLFALAEALFVAMKAGAGRDVLEKTLRDLLTYTKVHFAAEEQVIAQRDYPGLDAHRRVHMALTKRVQDFQDKFAAGSGAITIDLMQFLKEWLQKHIKEDDLSWAKFAPAAAR